MRALACLIALLVGAATLGCDGPPTALPLRTEPAARPSRPRPCTRPERSPPERVRRCLWNPTIPEDIRAAAARQARAVPPGDRPEMAHVLRHAVLDQPGPVRAAILDTLVRLGELSPTAAALVPPRRDAAREATRLLRIHGYDPAQLCEGDLHVAPSEGDALGLYSDGSTCPDGAYLLVRLTRTARGYRLISVRRTHTG